MKINYQGILVFIVFFVSISCKTKIIEHSRSKIEKFSFVQMCDPQLGMGGYDHDIKTFEQSVKQINEMKPDFVVICGDLVHNPNDSSFADFNRIRKGFKIPCYLAPGNHDVGKTPSLKKLENYRKVIGKDYYTFENKGIPFVITNTQLWKSNVGAESEKHYQWFRLTLDSLSKTKKPVFVVGHYPIFIKTPDEKEAYFNLPIETRKEILNLFKTNNVTAYLSGHKHETIINKYEGIQLVSGETTSKNFDKRPMGFRLWEVSSDTIFHNFVQLKGF